MTRTRRAIHLEWALLHKLRNMEVVLIAPCASQQNKLTQALHERIRDRSASPARSPATTCVRQGEHKGVRERREGVVRVFSAYSAKRDWLAGAHTGFTLNACDVIKAFQCLLLLIVRV